MEDTRFDDVLLNLAAQSGGIEPLLLAFFSFLHRKTDFYVTADFKPGTQVNMGFPPGGAERILLKAFRSFPYKPLPDTKGSSRAQGEARSGATTEGSTRRPATSTATGAAVPSASTPPPPPASHGARQEADSQAAAPGDDKNTIPAPQAATSGGQGGSSSSEQQKAAAPAVRLTESGKQVPISNGGVTESYYWTQSLHDVTVYVDVPKGTRSRDVVCDISATRLKVGLKGSGPKLDGVMPGSVKVQDSIWTLEAGETVVVTLEKVTPTWWASVVEGDPEIDTTMVDSTMKVEEYDPETQGAIRKIMFDQRQKALGLPTSDELQMQAMLDKAREAPGSPFKS